MQKYSTADLDKLIAEGVGDGSVQNWAAKMVASYGDMLKANPARYRAFGPYWWALKKLIGIGDFIDIEWLSYMDYGDPKYNVAAAFAYEESQFDLGLMTYPFHTLEDDDGNPVEYVSADPDMEGRPEKS